MFAGSSLAIACWCCSAPPARRAPPRTHLRPQGRERPRGARHAPDPRQARRRGAGCAGPPTGRCDLHLHGYDIEKRIEPGAVTEMTFTARATGRFPVEVHVAKRERRSLPWERPCPRSRSTHADARRTRAIGALAVAASCARRPAAAHGFGQRYELPLPLSFYLFGAAAAVVVSFVVVGLFVRQRARHAAIGVSTSSPVRSGGSLAHPVLVLVAQARRARPVRRDPRGGPHRRPKSLPQHRADLGVDHLVGRPRLPVGVRRKPLGADQPVAHAVRLGRASVPARVRRVALARAALSGGARRLAGVRPAVGIFLDRADLSEPRGSRCISRGSLSAIPSLTFTGMVAVRPRDLAARTARSSPSCFRHLRSLCAGRLARRSASPAGAAPARGRAPRCKRRSRLR